MQFGFHLGTHHLNTITAMTLPYTSLMKAGTANPSILTVTCRASPACSGAIGVFAGLAPVDGRLGVVEKRGPDGGGGAGAMSGDGAGT